MFVLAAALPIKIMYNAVEGTMANAGGRPTDFGPPYLPKTPYPTKVYPAQPQKPPKQSPVVQQPKTFVKAGSLKMHLGSEPIFITCPSCFELITTKVIRERSESTSNGSCLDCFSNSRKDSLHYCPTCHAFLGKFVP